VDERPSGNRKRWRAVAHNRTPRRWREIRESPWGVADGHLHPGQRPFRFTGGRRGDRGHAGVVARVFEEQLAGAHAMDHRIVAARRDDIVRRCFRSGQKAVLIRACSEQASWACRTRVFHQVLVVPVAELPSENCESQTWNGVCHQRSKLQLGIDRAP
jgi:hypothetical protein